MSANCPFLLPPSAFRLPPPGLRQNQLAFALEEAFAGLVTAPVFKTGEASETVPGGFDSHPLPLSMAHGSGNFC